jgi:hypothetical protein
MPAHCQSRPLNPPDPARFPEKQSLRAALPLQPPHIKEYSEIAADRPARHWPQGYHFLNDNANRQIA